MEPGVYSSVFIVNPENIFLQTIPINLTILDYTIIPGDINFDTLINVLDIVSIMNFVVNLKIKNHLKKYNVQNNLKQIETNCEQI